MKCADVYKKILYRCYSTGCADSVLSKIEFYGIFCTVIEKLVLDRVVEVVGDRIILSNFSCHTMQTSTSDFNYYKPFE